MEEVSRGLSSGRILPATSFDGASAGRVQQLELPTEKMHE